MDDMAAPIGQGPTVILVGGRMVVDDGSELDSRQPVADDPFSRVSRASLATSSLWWRTAASVVEPILASSGKDSFALVIGPRSTVELRHDGSFKRTRLRSYLSGGTTTVEVIWATNKETLPDGFERLQASPSWCSVGVKAGKPEQRWWFLDGMDVYLEHVAARIAPAVIVDTSESLLESTDEFCAIQFSRLRMSRLFSDNVTLIMPHTHRAEQLIEGYRSWVAAGCLPGDEDFSKLLNDRGPSAPPDPVRYSCPIPIEADFQVTGLFQSDSWRDPSDLEAARKLIQARFDLKLGIWDLVRNPVLCRTLLASVAVSAPPSQSAPVPSGAARRAAKKLASDSVDQETQRVVMNHLLAQLHTLGWQEFRLGALRLPLTDKYSRWEGDEPEPLVWLTLDILKRQVKVIPFALLYNHQDIDIGEYVRARQHVLQHIAASGAFSLHEWQPVIWGEVGGWADEVDWLARGRSLARRTEQWADVFKQLCDVSIEIITGKRPYQHRKLAQPQISNDSSATRRLPELSVPLT